MNETALQLAIFILAFGGMVVVHELGHFLAARMVGVEVEEFGIGFPTPGAIEFWSSKGYFFLRSGKRIEIPANFRMPVLWSELLDREVKITVDETDGRLVLRSIEAVVFEERRQTRTRTGEPVLAGSAEKPAAVKRLIKAGRTDGMTQLNEVISDIHAGTRFTLNWLPLGGFVRPKGENDPNVTGGLAAAAPWKRLFVLTAGPLMNLVTALLIYSFIVSRVGAYDFEKVLVTAVFPNSPAEQAGLKSGDIFISGNGEPIASYEDLSAIVGANEETSINFLMDRNGQQVSLSVIPRFVEEQNRIMIGVGLGLPYKTTSSPVEDLQWGVKYAGRNIYALLSMPAKILRGSLPAEQTRLIGLKGIYDIMGESIQQGIEASETATPTRPFYWYIPVLEIIAALSISLGVFNLFPFPALDGGRILFVLPELILRRRLSHHFENLVHGVGMTFLLVLMIYVNVRDFIDPISTIFP
ncbi:MAG: site-2 protease family protein [Chloroflexi bacterium]|nr:site-2 protease family protein [Chloroflexota bacterium]